MPEELRRTSLQSLLLVTTAVALPGSVIGFSLVMMWGLATQNSGGNHLLTLCGIVGGVLLLPTILLGFAIEPIGGLGMAVESLLMVVAQFFGYFGLLWGISHIQWQFSLRTLFFLFTVVAVLLGLAAALLLPVA